ncbi:MAG: hypothetical protein WC788_05280 [Candidatus Paceibacterota bacterium]|jgi:hypothetical protein
MKYILVCAAVALILVSAISIMKQEKREVEIPVVFISDSMLPRADRVYFSESYFDFIQEEFHDDRFPMKLSVKPVYRKYVPMEYNFSEYTESNDRVNGKEILRSTVSGINSTKPLFVFIVTNGISSGSVFTAEIQRESGLTDVFVVVGYNYTQMADTNYDSVIGSMREITATAVNQYVKLNNLTQ